MKKTMKAITGMLVAAAVVISSFSIVPAATAAPKAKKIVMNKKTVELKVGEKFELKVKKVSPKKANKKVTYKLNKKAKQVISITKKGVITAKAEGKATVKVISKSNKKVKTTVNVTVVAATLPTSAPVATATVAPTAVAKPTVAPVTATPKPTAKPTRTPRPTATPFKPVMKDPAAPYTLSFSESTVVVQDDASYQITNDGVVVNITAQYGGVAFIVPSNLTGNNYDTVTVTYKSTQNVGTGFGCGVWRASGSSETDKESEDVIAWEGVFSGSSSGTYTATIPQDATNAWYINKILFFNNDTDALANGPAKVTITKVEFSHSQYKK